jgi:putative ABC transport system substrate-binding protein
MPIPRLSTGRKTEAGRARIAEHNEVLVGADPFFVSRRDQLAFLAARHATPAIYNNRQYAVAGGLISYGTRVADAHH